MNLTNRYLEAHGLKPRAEEIRDKMKPSCNVLTVHELNKIDAKFCVKVQDGPIL